MTHQNEIERIRREYANRRERLAGNDKYAPTNPAHLFMLQRRQRVLVKQLRKHNLLPLSDKKILEVGCGTGGVLLEYLALGSKPENLFGCELLADRTDQAHALLPKTPILCADAQKLPYREHSFDIVLQYTVFSSIMEDIVKKNIAREMHRVLKPSGIIIWYDFRLNPLNRQTRGIRRLEIQNLFPQYRCQFNQITLAPPLIRILIPISWMLCELLENIKFLNTHLMVFMTNSTPSLSSLANQSFYGD